jgi:hypothetical protein
MYAGLGWGLEGVEVGGRVVLVGEGGSSSGLAV